MSHLSIIQIIVLALLQGVTELFPISSLGHTILLPALLGWGNLVTDTKFLALVVALHLGTSIALIIYFKNDWIQVIKSVVKSVIDGDIRSGTDSWVGWLVIIGCLPGGFLGLFLDTPLKHVFGIPVIAAIFLIGNGFILFFGERLYKNKKTKTSKKLSSLSWKDAIFIGFAQALALIPGISRSGSSIVAGLMSGLDHEDAARYSFLLGAPLISAAAILEIPSLLGQSRTITTYIIIGVVLSGIAAYISTKFLLAYFKTNTLKPFAYYSWIAGILALILILTGK